jgi:hypothetical protein
MTIVVEPDVATGEQQGEPPATEAVVPEVCRDRGEEANVHRRMSYLVGGVEALLSVGFYAVGWGRAFSYDASRTVQQFVAVDSIDQVFRQDRFNNHPLFSLLDHAVYRLTGSADERVLRVLPILLGALTVGLVAGVVVTHFGTAAGAVAGATLAVNGLVVRHFREVRGYSLVTLAAVIATLLLFQRLRKPRFTVTAAYVLALTLAIGTHMFVIGLVGLHVIVVLSSPPRRLTQWLLPWAGAVVVGLAIQWPAIHDGLTTPPVHRFNPTFPAAFAANLLGAGPAVPGMALLVASGWIVLRSRSWVPWVVVGTAAMIFACWLASPSWLSSRYFVWLVPAAAVAAGVGVSRRPRLGYVAGACVVAQLVVLTPGLAVDEAPNRVASAPVRAAHLSDLRVCALGRTRASLRAYTDEVPVVWDTAQLAGCDVALDAAGFGDEPLLLSACRLYAHGVELPAKDPGVVLAHQPFPLDPAARLQWKPAAETTLCREARSPGS